MPGGSFSTKGTQWGRGSGRTLRGPSAPTVFGALLVGAWRVGASLAGVLLVTGLLAGAGPVAPGVASAEDVFTYRAPNGVQHFTNVPTTKKFKSFAPPSQRLTLLSLKPSRKTGERSWKKLRIGQEMRDMISNTAYRFDLEPALVHAVVRAESGFNPKAVSRAGARGLMQLMPATALEVGVRDIFHPQENLDGGASYLRGLLDRYSGDVHLALAAYNAGPGAVESHGGVPPYAETQEYLRRVFRFRQEYLHDALRKPGGMRR